MQKAGRTVRYCPLSIAAGDLVGWAADTNRTVDFDGTKKCWVEGAVAAVVEKLAELHTSASIARSLCRSRLAGAELLSPRLRPSFATAVVRARQLCPSLYASAELRGPRTRPEL